MKSLSLLVGTTVVVLNVYFLHFLNCFKHDFHFDVERMIVRMLEMSRNISVNL